MANSATRSAQATYAESSPQFEDPNELLAAVRKEAAEIRLALSRRFCKELTKLKSSTESKVGGIEKAANKKYDQAVRMGAFRSVAELVDRLPSIATLSYFVIAQVGLGYSLGFYSTIPDLNVFAYFAIEDFFLSAFSNPSLLLVAVLSLALALWSLLRFGYVSVFEARADTVLQPRLRLFKQVLAMIFSVVVIPTSLSIAIGLASGYIVRHCADSDDWVTVTSSGEATESNGRLPNSRHTILLGTTSDFHLFFECRKPKSCREGVAFAIPSANISSLVYESRRPKRGEEGPKRPSDLLSALEEINKSIRARNIGVTLDWKELEKALSELNPDDPRLDQLIVSLSGIAQQINALNTLIRQIPIGPASELTPLPIVPEQIGEVVKELQVVLNDLARSGIGERYDPVTEDLLNRALSAIKESKRVFSNLLTVKSQCLLGYQTVGKIGPFQESEVHPEERHKKKFGERLTKVIDEFRENTPHHVLLVGRVDRRPLRASDQEDMELAQQRAERVQQDLLDRLERVGNEDWAIAAMSAIKRAAVIPSGPTELKSVNADDRSVVVKACWAAAGASL